MPLCGSNDESMSQEDNEDGGGQEKPFLSETDDSEGSEHSLTPPKMPECETNILPEVMQVDIDESSRNHDSGSVRPVALDNPRSQGQASRLHMLRQSALSLRERIEEETRRLKEAGVLSQTAKNLKPPPLPSTLWTDSSTSQIGDGAFQVEDLPGEVT